MNDIRFDEDELESEILADENLSLDGMLPFDGLVDKKISSRYEEKTNYIPGGGQDVSFDSGHFTRQGDIASNTIESGVLNEGAFALEGEQADKVLLHQLSPKDEEPIRMEDLSEEKSFAEDSKHKDLLFSPMELNLPQLEKAADKKSLDLVDKQQAVLALSDDVKPSVDYEVLSAEVCEAVYQRLTAELRDGLACGGGVVY